MPELTSGRSLFVAIALLAFGAGASAQSMVYKWVDEDGVVHFSDAPPDESTSAETVVIPKAPPAPTPSQPMTSAAAAARTNTGNQPAPNVAEAPRPSETTDISDLSIAELNLRCDNARERKIAPLRAAEIARCKESRRADPAFCERTNADFGEGGRNINGSMRPRMFDDLPECVDAMRETNRRGR